MLSSESRLELLHYMRLSRAIEDAAWALAGQGRLIGRLYTGHGQEAIPVGAAYALDPGDVIAPMYRDLGAHLVRGVTPFEVFAQYLGKVSSANEGRDSGLHIGDTARGIIGMISVLPDSVPVAVGAALAFKLRREPRIALATFGEGATSTGAWHEAVNMAAVLRTPIVFVCENNGWALSTPSEGEYASSAIVDRATGYGIPGVRVEGNDVEQVYSAVLDAATRAREGAGPTLVECVTMRMRGHSIIDPAEYVPSEQIYHWAARDPIGLYRARLMEQGIWDESRDAAEVEAVRDAVEEAIGRAEALPDPSPGDAHAPVFAGGPDA
jgi:TPP-dependent pyruvate/acetoin dehydrogenase alpha subunit